MLYKKAIRASLTNRITIFLIVLFLGCSVIKKHDVSEGKDKLEPQVRKNSYIDYVFPRSVDSLVTLKLQSLPDEICKNDIVLFYSAEYQLKQFLLPLRNIYSTADYYIKIYYIPDWSKKSNLSYINFDPYKYVAKRTNRFAVFNKGGYVLPMVFSDDLVLMRPRSFKEQNTPNVLWEDILSFWVYYTDHIKIEKEGGMLEIQKWRIENMDKNGDIMNQNKGIIE